MMPTEQAQTDPLSLRSLDLAFPSLSAWNGTMQNSSRKLATRDSARAWAVSYLGGKLVLGRSTATLQKAQEHYKKKRKGVQIFYVAWCLKLHSHALNPQAPKQIVGESRPGR
jgi:hypothetical protein